VLEFVEDSMPAESAVAFGLHPNAEIGFKLREAANFRSNLQSLQPHEAGGEDALSEEELARQVLESLTERIPPNFDLDDIRSRVDEYTPYVMWVMPPWRRDGGMECECCVSKRVGW